MKKEMNYIGKDYPDIWHIIYQEKHKVYDYGKQIYYRDKIPLMGFYQ